MWIFDEPNAAEIAWTLYNFVGVLLAFFLCVDLIQDSRDRLLMKDRQLRRTTYLCLSITGVFMAAMLVYVAIGLISMTQPSLVPGVISPQQYVAAIGFMVVATLKIGVLAAWRWMRFSLRREGVSPSLTLGKARRT
jgi:succinate dehydrogenase/fumarate reductase cytochrome b subunit